MPQSNLQTGYEPNPIDTSQIELTDDILQLTEELAESNHDNWVRQRLQDGWKLGLERNDQKKTHPCLIPYDQLPESEKQYDRNTAMETIKAIMALGYRINKTE